MTANSMTVERVRNTPPTTEARTAIHMISPAGRKTRKRPGTVPSRRIVAKIINQVAVATIA